jgi:hypothetical protein
LCFERKQAPRVDVKPWKIEEVDGNDVKMAADSQADGPEQLKTILAVSSG